MTYTEAREILAAQNAWWKDGGIICDELGQAIDVAIDALDSLEKGAQFDAIFRAARRNPAYYGPGRSRRLARHKARAQAGRRWETYGHIGASYDLQIRRAGVIHWTGHSSASSLYVVRPSRQKVRAK